jgi:uncharacterized protein (DUF488 family)
VLDVRRFPGSRRLPQFASGALARGLARHDITYSWLPALGGRRRSVAEPSASPNGGWRHPAFRAYADHIATEEFAGGLDELLTVALGMRSVILCAEILWWRCHRRLIADVLVSTGVRVWHIRDAGPAEAHRLVAPARLVRGTLSYAPRTRSTS